MSKNKKRKKINKYTSKKNIEKVVKATVQKEDKYTLPIEEIKADLLKIILFAIFVIGGLIFLKITGVSFKF